ncbi:hypothetical protein GWN42_31185 [candidate division KSB1 bacterium]|nr:hypothetical protein [Phycisphaerae bacterium]NIQ92523.1 hypothetical protein [Deltaproteobacteria bacterium]NIV97133.1 hypothetical protein [candidate division KSB1 bacterium]
MTVIYESKNQIYVYGVDSEDEAWDALHDEGLMDMGVVTFDWYSEHEKRYLFTIEYPSGEEESPENLSEKNASSEAPREIEPGSLAEACYDMNTVEELLEASLYSEPDEADLARWRIDRATWHEQVQIALENKLAD